MNTLTTMAPYWVALPNTQNAKVGGASYDNEAAARTAAEARPEPEVAVIGTRIFLGRAFPHVVTVITK